MIIHFCECKDFDILEKIVKNVKTSQTFNETEQIIDEMMENVHKIRQNRENNLVTVTEQKRIIEQEIWELREKMNNHLDKLQGYPCSLQYNCNLSLCSLQNSLISKTNDGNFWYSEIDMVLWFREVFDKTSTKKGYNYTVKSIDVLVAEFVLWKIIANAKVLIFLKK
jgi:hypothetical protein